MSNGKNGQKRRIWIARCTFLIYTTIFYYFYDFSIVDKSSRISKILKMMTNLLPMTEDIETSLIDSILDILDNLFSETKYKICPYCEKEYKRNRVNRYNKYCSPQCARAANHTHKMYKWIKLAEEEGWEGNWKAMISTLIAQRRSSGIISGIKIDEIAKMVGLSKSRAHKIIQDAGIKPRNLSNSHKIDWSFWQKIFEKDREHGMSCYKIAAKYDFKNSELIRRGIQKHYGWKW